MDLFYQEYGEGGPPLIILHGLLGASGNWHTLSRSVFSEHFHVYSLDARNHGRSPHDDVFDYPSMAADVIEFLDAKSINEASILGHSMGGKTAMWAALAHPERVTRLVVADIAPRSYPPHHLPILDALRSIDLTMHSSRTGIDRALAADIPEAGVRQFLLKNLASDGAGGYSWKMNLPAIYAGYANVNTEIPHSRGFPKPTLFIRGGRSKYIEATDRPDIKRLFPASRIEELPNAGHWVHAEAPKPFADLVVEFLTG